MAGTSITAQTAHTLRLRPPRFQPITRVSADGVDFPDEPSVFKAEIARQAAELYGGRAGLEVDIHRLLTGGQPGRHLSTDTPDFTSMMSALLNPNILDQNVGGPPSFTDKAGKSQTRGS